MTVPGDHENDGSKGNNKIGKHTGEETTDVNQDQTNETETAA